MSSGPVRRSSGFFPKRRPSAGGAAPDFRPRSRRPDRKSTRLNSSHGYISYAVNPDLPPFPTRRSSDLTGFRPADRLPIARELGDTSLAFLTHPTLSPADVERTCAAIERVFSEATA